jgi:hypothetical protein
LDGIAEVVLVWQSGVVSRNSKSLGQPLAREGMGGPIDGVVRITAGFSLVVQVLLELPAILAEVMQQPSLPSFGPETQRLGKPFRQLRDIPQVRGQQLPFGRIQV